MNIYEIEYDTTTTIVEAEGFGDAVKTWRAHFIAESKTNGDYEEADLTRDPDQVIRRHNVTILPGREWHQQVLQFLAGLQQRGRLGSDIHDRIHELLGGPIL